MAEKIVELEKKVHELETRIANLEKKANKQLKQVAKDENQSDFSGLSGGLRYLISKGFLNQPRAATDVQGELKKEGYHYSTKSVDWTLRVDLMQKRKVLTRVKEEKIWKYVIRK